MAGGASSSSSFTTSDFTYGVFLSFRGEDTRLGFTGNLYDALVRRGIVSFIDDQQLQRGNEITPSLVKAIEESRIAIVVLSENYATSKFCLDELAKIMDCFKGKKSRLVIPVFYDVDPSHVRKHTGTFGKALAAHEEDFKDNSNSKDFNDNMERLTKWRVALKQVADLSGYHFKHGYGYEHKFIAKIVDQVSRVIRRVALHFVDHPVGLDSQVKNVISLLDVGSSDGVRILGIHGTGGIGKTTLAVAVYNWIADHFEDSSFEGLCFLENVRENSSQHNLKHLQKMILSEIAEEKEFELTGVRQGISILKQRLHQKKILLILDDVDQHEQLEALAGKSNWFGPGSRVIITTRDINLLTRYEDKITYEVETMNEKDAIELLTWKAFKTHQVDPSYMDILNEAINYASGLPLALEVIGSNLVGKSVEQWKAKLDQYKRIPIKKIQAILKVSYDALEDFEKEIFLDITCCLKGYVLKDVKEILCAHHGVASVENGLEVLVEKSLIKIYGYGYPCKIHDLIQDMGKEIVRQESHKEPGQYSRLWLLEDIVQVFEKKMGTDKIQMIHMDFPISEKVINWDGEAFKKMTNIRTLIIEQACFSRGPKLLPNSLRVLKWRQYPSQSLPIGFHPEELVISQLCDSSLTSIEFLHKQKLESLTVIDFDRSNIKEIPDLSGVPNLEKLSFGSCENLITVDKSVGLLDKLKLLDAAGCSSLRGFPPIRLTNLEHLRLERCISLEEFPEILGEMENILETAIYGTSIKELPSSIAYLSKLRRLTLGNSATSLLISSITMLPCLKELSFEPAGKRLQFPKLDEGEEQRSSMLSPNGIKVAFKNCNMSDEYWPVLVAWFRNVVELDLRGNNFTVLPESIQELCSLRRLDLTDCKKLQEIRGMPPNMNDFLAVNCISLTSSSKMMLLNEEFHKDGNKFVHLPGSSIPEWFEYNNTGSTIPEWFKHDNTESSIEFWFRNKFPEICLCVIVGFYDLIQCWGSINGVGFSAVGSSPLGWLDCSSKEHIAIVGLKRMNIRFDDDNMDEFPLANEWNHLSFFFSAEPMRSERMRKIGVHVINHKSSMEDDIQFSDPEDDIQFSDPEDDFQFSDPDDDSQFSDPEDDIQFSDPEDLLPSLLHSLPMNSWDHPPAENSLKDYVSNSVAQIGISSATNNVQATQLVKITDLAADRQEKNWSDNSPANTSTQKQSVSASQKPSQSKGNPEQGIPSEVIREQSKEETLVQSPLEDADVFAIDDDDDDAEYRPTKRARRADQEDTILTSDSTIAENKPTTSLINTEEVVGCDNNIQIKEHENLDSDSDDDEVDLSFMDDIDEGLSDVLNKPNPSSTSVSDLRSINPSLEHQISTETHATETDPETPEIPLKQLYELLHILNEPVDSLAENDDMKQKLLNLIFDLNKKTLPPAVKPVIQTLENFIHGVFDTILEVKRIEMDKETFAATLCSLEKDLKKAQKSKNKIEAGLCKAKSGQLELESQISDLMSKKKLLDSGIAKGEAELAKTNEKLASLTQDKEEKTKALSQASVQLERANMSKMKLLEDQSKLKLSIRSFLG